MYKRRPRRFNRRRSRTVKASLPNKSLAYKAFHTKQTYLPSAAALVVDGTNMTYSAPNGTLLGPNAGAPGLGTFTLRFVASDLPNYTEWATVYDAYRINKVIVKMVPLISNIQVTPIDTAINTAQQFMSTVIDYDDSSQLSSYNACLEYATFKETPCYRTHKRVLTPAIAMEAFKTSGTTIGYVQKRKQWVDMANGDVEHYGIKGVIPNNTHAIQQQWKVFVTMYISFKQVR